MNEAMKSSPCYIMYLSPKKKKNSLSFVNGALRICERQQAVPLTCQDYCVNIDDFELAEVNLSCNPHFISTDVWEQSQRAMLQLCTN